MIDNTIRIFCTELFSYIYVSKNRQIIYDNFVELIATVHDMIADLEVFKGVSISQAEIGRFL